MRFPTLLHTASTLIFGAILATASAAEPPTLLTERGKVLLSEDFTNPPGKEWRSPKGKWETVEGTLRGAEVAEQKHGAVIRYPLAFRDVIIQYDVKLDGAKVTSLSINNAKEHVCRVQINAGGFVVQKDDHDHAGPDKVVVLQKVATPIKPGEWHTVVVEVLGQEMLASLDGGKAGFGAHEMIAGDKANFGFTVAGQTASFRNLRVWEALPNKDWAANKTKLTAALAK